jgi:hypothetical protein
VSVSRAAAERKMVASSTDGFSPGGRRLDG